MSQEKLKIVFLNDSARIGGAERSLILLAKHLNPLLFETIVICPIGGPLIEELKEAGIRVIPQDISCFSRKGGLFSYIKCLASLLKLFFLLRDLNVDIIHCNSPRAAHWGIPIGQLLSLRTICHVRNINESRFTYFILKCYQSKVKFIAISNYVRMSLINIGIKDNNIYVIYNCVDIKKYNRYCFINNIDNEFMSMSNKLKIGIIGRIIAWKRHIDVIKAVALLLNRIDLLLFIVGEEWGAMNLEILNKLKLKSKTLGVDDKVIFTGFQKNIPGIIAGLDIIVVPSIGEPFGRVIIEAMAMGKPVIGTCSGGIPEIIQDGLNGILVPVRSPKSIAEAIEYIFYNKEQANKLISNAQNRVIDCFSLEKHIKKIQELYLNRL